MMNDNVDFDALKGDEILYHFSVHQLNENYPIRIVMPCQLPGNETLKISHSSYGFITDKFEVVTDFIKLAIESNPGHANIWSTFAEFLNNLKSVAQSFEVKSDIYALCGHIDKLIELPPAHRGDGEPSHCRTTGLQFALSCRQAEYAGGHEPNVPVYSFDYTVTIPNSTGE